MILCQHLGQNASTRSSAWLFTVLSLIYIKSRRQPRREGSIIVLQPFQFDVSNTSWIKQICVVVLAKPIIRMDHVFLLYESLKICPHYIVSANVPPSDTLASIWTQDIARRSPTWSTSRDCFKWVLQFRLVTDITVWLSVLVWSAQVCVGKRRWRPHPNPT